MGQIIICCTIYLKVGTLKIKFRGQKINVFCVGEDINLTVHLLNLQYFQLNRYKESHYWIYLVVCNDSLFITLF